MMPIICFYQGNYIYSNQYDEINLLKNNWENQIKEIEKLYFNELKIIQIDYDFGLEFIIGQNIDKPRLHGKPNCSVFILTNYNILSREELTRILDRYKKEHPITFTPLISKSAHEEAVNTALSAIRSGEIYQLNLTFPFIGKTKDDALENFSYFHNKFHGEYHAFVPRADGYSIICLSPELFLKKIGTIIESRPIKGTCKTSLKEIDRLIKSEKETAELSMIVDLLRNDLNSIANIKSSEVTEHRSLINLGDLVHTFSNVKAETNMNFAQIIKNTFPGGSISGCPKKRACEYIEKIEPYPRGHYTGSIGWWEKDSFELNIVIRSFIQCPDQKIYYHAGGGIVLDSIPELEYQEALLKSSRIEK